MVEVVDNGAKNIADFHYIGLTPASAATGVTCTESNGTFTMSGTASGGDYSCYILYKYKIKVGTYTFSGFTGGSSTTTYMRIGHDIGAGDDAFLFSVTTEPVDYTFNTEETITVQLVVKNGNTATSSTIYPMICVKAQFGISSAYEPYALGNQVITPELIELCDSGAKNILDFANTVITDTSTTSTKTSAAVTVTNSTALYGNSRFSVSIPSGTYTLSFKVSSLSVAAGTRAVVEIYTNSQGSGAPVQGRDITANGNYKMPFVSTGITYYVLIYSSRGSQVSSNTITISDWMICTKAAFSVSPKFVPYRPNYDLVSEYVTTARTKLVYCNSQGSSNTHKYTMQFSDFKYAQFTDSETQTCGTYLVSVVTWGYTPKHGLWIVSYSGGNRTYTALTNIVGADAATVSVVTDDGTPYIQVVASGKVSITTLG